MIWLICLNLRGWFAISLINLLYSYLYSSIIEYDIIRDGMKRESHDYIIRCG